MSYYDGNYYSQINLREVYLVENTLFVQYQLPHDIKTREKFRSYKFQNNQKFLEGCQIAYKLNHNVLHIRQN